MKLNFTLIWKVFFKHGQQWVFQCQFHNEQYGYKNK